MKKSLCSLALALSLALGAFPLSALAADADFIIENAVLTKYTGRSSSLYSNNAAYYGKDAYMSGCQLADVVIPEGIAEIGSYAFYFAVGVTGVTIPEGVVKIGSDAFNHCNSMTSVSFPSSVTEIGENAFFWTALKRAVLPDGVTCVGGQAFALCGGLTDITLPSSVAEIGENAFLGCDSLTIHGASGSYAAAYAAEYGIPFHADLACDAVQVILVDGVPVEFQTYTLTDENGGVTNYVKLRDVAHVLNGTAAQFEVEWDGAVNIVTGTAYTPDGSEMSVPFTGDRAYRSSSAATVVNGAPASLDAITLTNGSGGDYTYYKLRDLGAALGFHAGWSQETGVFLESGKPYFEP